MNPNPHADPIDDDLGAVASPSPRCAPTNESQREIWLGDRMGRDASLSFSLPKWLRLSGPLDPAALQQAIKALVQRHDALRAVFGDDGESMTITPDGHARWGFSDLSTLAADAREQAARALVQQQLEIPFDLDHGPLIGAHLIRLAPQEHQLLLSAHHIVCDGWSWQVLLRELAALYRQACGGPAAALPPPESFVDYACRQQHYLQSAEHAQDEAFWLSKFAGTPPVLDLPTDRPRGRQRSFASVCIERTVDAALVAELKRLAGSRRAGLFATVLAGYTLLLARLAGEDTVVVGVPVAGQLADDVDGLVGNCVSLLPLRLDLDLSQPFSASIDAAQEVLFEALDHQRVTFGSLLKQLPLARDPGRTPLVSVLLNLEPAGDFRGGAFADLRMEALPDPRRYESFEMFLNAVQMHDGSLRLECQFNTDFFEAATVHRWLGALEALLRDAVAQPSRPAGELSMLDAAAQAELSAVQPAPLPYAADLRMHERFERQCDATPHRTAVQSEAGALSYAALEARANAIAHALRGAGIGDGQRVGLALERTPDMVAALLGILKSGAAYVPLDPGFPAERLAFMIADAGLSGLVTSAGLRGQFDLPDKPVLVLDDPASAVNAAPGSRLGRDGRAAQPESCAYVIYTSGSTGRPKGVCVPHRAVSNFLEAMVAVTGLGAEDRLVAVTTLSFDIAVLELLLPLSIGATVVLASRDTAMQAPALIALLAQSGATAMQATPATWQLLTATGWRPPTGFRVLCGGEPLPPELAARLLETSEAVLNLYGPTETTVWSSACWIPRAAANALPDINIGRPIANTQVWILDPRGNPLPIGVPGEICIGGEGVTLGYLERPDLTADRFIADTLGTALQLPGHGREPRLYRTGDRGRWRPDGVLEHLGRLDNQVKLRGFRIELGEVQAQALAIDGVEQALALVREFGAGDARLLLYLVARSPLDTAAVLVGLRKQLPEYMLPQHIIVLDALPTLPNGKLDRHALPLPEMLADADLDAQPPRNALERAIADTMAELLGRRLIGIHDDFFTHGGHSLLAAQLIGRLNRKLGLALAWRALFDAPTVARLAEAIGDQRPDLPPEPRITRRDEQASAPLTVAQERLLLLEEYSAGRSNFNLPVAFRLTGPLEREAVVAALRSVAQRQAVLRTCIASTDRGALQLVAAQSADLLDPETIDLSGLPGAEREPALRRHIEQLSGRSFALSARPPFRATLFKLGPRSHVLFFLAHHILWDGWSTQLLVDELAELFSAQHDQRTPALTELPVSFGDYAQHHRQWLASEAYAEQRSYWQRQLQAGSYAPGIDHDRPGSAGSTGRAGSVPIEFDHATVAALRAHAQQQDATLFMALLTLWAVVLQAATDRGDVVIGVPVSGRHHADVEHVMGFFTSLLPLRVAVPESASFSRCLAGIRSVVLDGFSHPGILLEDLPAITGGTGRHAGQPYHALLSYADLRAGAESWGGLRCERLPVHPATTAEDLGLWFAEDRDGLRGQLIYNADLISAASATRLQRNLVAAARAVAVDPAVSLVQLCATLERAPVPAITTPPAAATRAGPSALMSSAMQAASTSATGQALTGSSDNERLLLELFCELFDSREIGLDDNFFELGGNSLLALRLIKRVQDASGARLNLIALATGTVGSLARLMPAPKVEAAAPGSLRGLTWRRLFGRPQA